MTKNTSFTQGINHFSLNHHFPVYFDTLCHGGMSDMTKIQSFLLECVLKLVGMTYHDCLTIYSIHYLSHTLFSMLTCLLLPENLQCRHFHRKLCLVNTKSSFDPSNCDLKTQRPFDHKIIDIYCPQLLVFSHMTWFLRSTVLLIDVLHSNS